MKIDTTPDTIGAFATAAHHMSEGQDNWHARLALMLSALAKEQRQLKVAHASGRYSGLHDALAICTELSDPEGYNEDVVETASGIADGIRKLIKGEE